MQRICRALAVLVLALCWASTVWAEGDDAPRWESRTQVEDYAASLDRRVIELQHEILAARHNRDQTGLERAQKDLKAVQAQRVEALRSLGQLP
jgi:hypothetical protein